MRNLTSETIEKIGDRYFSIIVIDKYDTASAEFSKKLLSTTTIEEAPLILILNCLARKKIC